jgi:hypothetical protein
MIIFGVVFGGLKGGFLGVGVEGIFRLVVFGGLFLGVGVVLVVLGIFFGEH